MEENGSTKRLILEQALSEYLRRTDQGEEIDQAEFLKSHPDIKDELARYLADCEALDRLLREIRNSRTGDSP